MTSSLKNKIGAIIKKINNLFYDFILIKDINELSKDINPLYSWSTTTQSLDYIYLKHSLKNFNIESKDRILDLGSGKGRLLLYLYSKFNKNDVMFFGAEINKEAYNLSLNFFKDKRVEIYNINAMQNNFIKKNNINKIILFNPFSKEIFTEFLDYLCDEIEYQLTFIYINISKEQIEIAQKKKIKYKIIEIDKPLIGIYNKVNLIGYINE